jgi:hypothetical protein
MNSEQVNSDIQCLERMFAAPDPRPLTESDLWAANQWHDRRLANSPWFRLWQSYGICCRSESPELRLPQRET